jgi:hypothetical protein
MLSSSLSLLLLSDDPLLSFVLVLLLALELLEVDHARSSTGWLANGDDGAACDA